MTLAAAHPDHAGAAHEIRWAAAHELALCQSIRHAVFVLGQGVRPEEEVDGEDPACRHVLARRGGAAVGTARVKPMGRVAKVQRVAVLPEARGAGVGAAIMVWIADRLAEEGAWDAAVLGAQTHAVGFYERLGWRAEGPEYLDARMPHRDMRLRLPNRPAPAGAT